MKRWMNLFFLLWGTACTITATTEDGTYFSSVENVSVATFENVPSDCYISVDKHNYRPYVARVQDSGVVYVQNRTFTSTHTAVSYTHLFREAERSCRRTVGQSQEDEGFICSGRDDKPLHGLVLGRDCRVVIG